MAWPMGSAQLCIVYLSGSRCLTIRKPVKLLPAYYYAHFASSFASHWQCILASHWQRISAGAPHSWRSNCKTDPFDRKKRRLLELLMLELHCNLSLTCVELLMLEMLPRQCCVNGTCMVTEMQMFSLLACREILICRRSQQYQDGKNKKVRETAMLCQRLLSLGN